MNEAASQEPSERPVFVFAASWRTGSTLVQRILTASNSLFIWGEPRYLDELVQLYGRITEVQARAGRTEQDYAGLSWVPTLFPDRGRIDASFRIFLRELYLAPVREKGYTRWGFKEVRPNAVPAARLLHHLFPAARFVFLVRDPLATYLSLRNMPMHARFEDPMEPVRGWRDNAADFLRAEAEGSLPAILVRFEDLAAGGETAERTLLRICDHAGLDANEAMRRELAHRTGAAPTGAPLSAAERQEVLLHTREIAERLGYTFT